MSTASAIISMYAQERAKRLRPDKTAQYSDFRDPNLKHMDADPWVDYDKLQSAGYPLKDAAETKVLIVGAGFHGLLAAHQMITVGGLPSEDIVLVDKAGGVGGTWYWNRYPGVMCDIEGYCYMPLLEETGYMPQQRYNTGYEIRKHCERIAATWNMQTQLCTTVKDHCWDEDQKRWKVSMSHVVKPGQEPRQITVRAQFLFLASGLLPSPHIPKLNGVHNFTSSAGKILMHTARWDWRQSGGSETNPSLAGFRGKRVGIIGTGATSVQVTPWVARQAQHTYVFQRTPSYVGPQLQTLTSPQDWKSMTSKDGWQDERVDSLDAVFTAKHNAVDLVQDSWTKVSGMRALAGNAEAVVHPGQEAQHLEKMLELDLKWTNEMRARIDEQVEDSTVAEKLKPWYPGFCKRPTFHHTYLSTFNEPNVTLVDTDGKGVTSYEPEGVVANGRKYELDVLILATGYTVGVADASPGRLLGAPIYGRDGLDLAAKWASDDYGVVLAQMISGFPNMFFLTGEGGALSQNVTGQFKASARFAARVIKETLRRAKHPGRAVVETTKAGEDWWAAKVAERSLWHSTLPSCTPGYATGEGLVQEMAQLPKDPGMEAKMARKSLYGGGVLKYREEVRKWLDSKTFDGVTFEG